MYRGYHELLNITAYTYSVRRTIYVVHLLLIINILLILDSMMIYKKY